MAARRVFAMLLFLGMCSIKLLIFDKYNKHRLDNNHNEAITYGVNELHMILVKRRINIVAMNFAMNSNKMVKRPHVRWTNNGHLCLCLQDAHPVIANLNVNSLTRHVDDIRITLTNYPFDILAINETKLDSSISDSEIYINGYTIIRKDRNRNGGGIAIYIKNNISHFERVDLTLDSGNLELICIEINDYIVGPSY
jgi:hypothetical protein